METEKIYVPKFEGFECIGLVIPSENLPCKCLTFSAKEGEAYLSDIGIHDAAHRICYRKIKPKRVTLESTGIYDFVSNGEYYMDLDGKIKMWTFDKQSDCVLEIFKEVKE